MKHYAKKREPFAAAQWTGEMTPDLAELVRDRNVSVDEQQLILGNGRYAQVGDWICAPSGEDLSVTSDEMIRKSCEEVDDKGRSLPPTDDEHDSSYREFLQELDALLVAGLKLSGEDHPGIFRGRDKLVQMLRWLLEAHALRAEQRERKRVRDKIAKDLWP